MRRLHPFTMCKRKIYMLKGRKRRKDVFLTYKSPFYMVKGQRCAAYIFLMCHSLTELALT